MPTKFYSNMTTFITRTRYRKEIISILIIKLIGLFLLWYLFFSHPTDHKLTVEQLTKHYTTTPQTPNGLATP